MQSKLAQFLQFFRGFILLAKSGESAHILQLEIIQEGILVFIDGAAIHIVAAGRKNLRSKGCTRPAMA